MIFALYTVIYENKCRSVTHEKMESRGESELQQLVSSDADGENDDSIVQDDSTITEDKIASPIRSNKVVRYNKAKKIYHNNFYKFVDIIIW